MLFKSTDLDVLDSVRNNCRVFGLPCFRSPFVLSHSIGGRPCSGDSGARTLHASPSDDRLRRPAELPATRG